MADSKSIASRMEKLAKLKRMKEGVNAQSSASEADVTPAVEAEAPVIGAPAAEAFEEQSPEAVFSQPPDHASSISTVTEITEADGSAQSVDSDDGSFDFVPPELSEEELGFSQPPVAAEDENSDEEIEAESAMSLENDDVGFVMEDSSDAVDEVEESTSVEVAVEEDDLDFPPVVEEREVEEDVSAEAHGIDDNGDFEVDNVAAIAGAAGVAAAVSASSDDAATDNSEIPDFSENEIDDELLRREFEEEMASDAAHEEPEVAETPDTAIAGQDDDGRTTVSFDESRSTLLNHVSRQMGCSVEDVVVTALDWYLDALFGEDDEAKSA